MIVNGWRIFVHKLFIDQLEELVINVEKSKEKDPDNYRSKNASKRLAAILKLAFDAIPQDPTLSVYRQGDTLGTEHKHWFRAKFFQQYRLFFRYHLKEKIIVYAWVNDEKTKRAYGSKNDAYRLFEKMLNNGKPPDDWNKLLEQSKLNSEILNKLISN